MGAAIWRGITHRVWPGILSPIKSERPGVLASEEETADKAEVSESKRSGDEQIIRLVRQIFLAGPGAKRHVVFSPVGQDTDMADVCHRVAITLATHANSDACWVDITSDSANANLQRSGDRIDFKKSASMICGNLWRVRGATSYLGSLTNSGNHLAEVMTSLKSEFGYSIIQSSSPVDGDTAALGRLCDGVVLVLRAGFTRRVAARRAKEILESANVRILGTILCDREFPIPETLYRMF
jgi:hypothetical protein